MPRSSTTNVSSVLKSMGASWKKQKKAAIEAGSINEAPDGDYLFKISQWSIGVNKNKNVMATMRLVIIDGPEKGSQIISSRYLGKMSRGFEANDYGMQQFCRELVSVGIDENKIPDDLSKLPQLLDKVVKGATAYSGRLTYNDEGFARITRLRVSEESVGEDEPDEASIDFDDLDEEELRKYISQEEIDIKELGFKSKKAYNKADEDDLREALENYIDKGDENEDEDEDEDEVDEDEDEVSVNDLKKFCVRQGVELKKKDKASIKTIKKAISKYKYDKEDLSKKDIKILKDAGLSICIKK